MSEKNKREYLEKMEMMAIDRQSKAGQRRTFEKVLEEQGLDPKKWKESIETLARAENARPPEGILKNTGGVDPDVFNTFISELYKK